MLTLRNSLFIRLMLCTSIMSLDQIYGIRSLFKSIYEACRSPAKKGGFIQGPKGMGKSI